MPEPCSHRGAGLLRSIAGRMTFSRLYILACEVPRFNTVRSISTPASLRNNAVLEILRLHSIDLHRVFQNIHASRFLEDIA
jgi:hypothetical protein